MADPQRQRVRQAAGRQGRHRVHSAGQRVRRYELPVLQAEFSVTQTLDAPVTGRIFSGQPLVSLRRRRTGVKIGGWYCS